MEGGWPGPGSGGLRSPRMRFRRDVVEDMKEGVHDVEEEIMDLEKKAEEELAPVAETLHVAPWSVQISLYCLRSRPIYLNVVSQSVSL